MTRNWCNTNDSRCSSISFSGNVHLGMHAWHPPPSIIKPRVNFWFGHFPTLWFMVFQKLVTSFMVCLLQWFFIISKETAANFILSELFWYKNLPHPLLMFIVHDFLRCGNWIINVGAYVQKYNTNGKLAHFCLWGR